MLFMQSHESETEKDLDKELETYADAPDVEMTREQAIDAYLANSAMANFPENMLCVDSAMMGVPGSISQWESWF